MVTLPAENHIKFRKAGGVLVALTFFLREAFFVFKREEYVDFSWTFSFLCSARCFLACSLCRWRRVKSSFSGGMTNGFLLSSAFPIGSCASVGAVEGAGIGGRGTCLVRLEREPGVPV